MIKFNITRSSADFHMALESMLRYARRVQHEFEKESLELKCVEQQTSQGVSQPSYQGYVHMRSHSRLSPSEMPPQKRGRFGTRMDFERIFYGDIICYICSFLSIEELSSSMRVSKTFGKNARKARRNTENLRVSCTYNAFRFVKSVVANCEKLKSMVLEYGTTISKEQICTILEHSSETMVEIVNPIPIGVLPAAVSPTNPINYNDGFLGFTAHTLKNLRSVDFRGCYQSYDFVDFARSCCMLERCTFFLFVPHFLFDWVISFMEAVKIILLRNPNLKKLSLTGFAGVAEVLLEGPECPALRQLFLVDCHISQQMKKRLAKKFPKLSELVCQEMDVLTRGYVEQLYDHPGMTYQMTYLS